MAAVIAGKRRIKTTRVRRPVVNGVVPIVIVIGGDSVPAAVVRLQRVMRPANAGIGASHNNVLSGESQCPYLWCVRVTDSWFDPGRLRRRFLDTVRLRHVIVDERVAFHSRHFRAGRQCLCDLAVTLH
jgi:hypothetical protein